MKIHCLFFGHYRDIVPEGVLALELLAGATVADAAQRLAAQDVRLADLLTRNRAAVGGEFAAADSVLRDGDEVAFLPPMSGG